MTGASSNIAVWGAGALGSYFGAVLALAGRNVTLVGRKSHIDAINRYGLILQDGTAERRAALAASTDGAAIRGSELILFCVKSNDTDVAARQMAANIAPDAVIVSLQNGVDNVERIGRHVRNAVISASVYIGANIPAPGRVVHTAGNRIVIGWLGDADGMDTGVLTQVAGVFGSAGISVQISDRIDVDLWIKLVMNAAYNAICALGGAPYGRMVAVPAIRDLMREVVGEVVQVARAKGIGLPDDIVDRALALADTMPTTRSSTAQDLEKGRPTEIDHLNGYIAREAEALGIAAPVNRTLTALIKLLEQTRSVRGPP